MRELAAASASFSPLGIDTEEDEKNAKLAETTQSPPSTSDIVLDASKLGEHSTNDNSVDQRKSKFRSLVSKTIAKQVNDLLLFQSGLFQNPNTSSDVVDSSSDTPRKISNRRQTDTAAETAHSPAMNRWRELIDRRAVTRTTSVQPRTPPRELLEHAGPPVQMLSTAVKKMDIKSAVEMVCLWN
jgi:hypothetical protein